MASDELPPRTSAHEPPANELPVAVGPGERTARTSVAAPRPSPAAGPVSGTAPRPPSTAKARPDPRPMRLGLGAAAVAAVTVMVGGMVRFPVGDPAVSADEVVTADAATTQQVRVEKRVRYVQLRPGEKAPPGAKVIDSAEPTPRVVVTRIQQRAPAQKTKTRQSGRR